MENIVHIGVGVLVVIFVGLVVLCAAAVLLAPEDSDDEGYL